MIIPIMSIGFISLGFICRKDKRMFYLLLAFMIIIIIANTYNADWDAYEFMYGQINSIDRSSLTDIGYGFLNYVSNSIFHLSFFHFRALFTFIGMLIIGRTILNYSPYPALVLALYFIAPFFPNDIIQIRNFMAQAILIFFISKWIDNNKFKYLFIAIGLSTMMHSSCIYFVIFILLLFINDEKKLYISVGVGSLFVGILPTLLNKLPFVSSEKILFYLGKTNNSIDIRGIIIIAVFFVQLYMLYYIRNKLCNSGNKDYYRWADYIYKMNILCIPACIIMTVWSFNFYRVPRNMLLLNYIIYSMYIKENHSKRIIEFMTLILILLGVCWSTLNSFSQWNVIWNNNAIIKW